ncbi:ATP-dependent DNA helicase RRM3-like [Apium graveolens]|uniref:ATP-dependent DNA helicase RRM3-like n=1 Tax=Apium graveolens TaxID=4045 RepID=UPI003D79DEC6
MSWRMFATRQYKKKTKLEAWFGANQTFPNARNYSYSEFPNKFTWHPQPGIWKERKKGDVIGRLSEVHSSSGELLYLCMLLLRKKGSMSFEDLKTVNGHIHEKFKEACAALGLLQNDNQWHEAISENSHTSLPPQLREMFVNILAYRPISDPLRLWEANWQCMSDDILIIRRHMLNDPHLYLSDKDLKNYALAEIEKLCNDIEKSLKDYATMPFPSGVYFSNAVNRLLHEETSYDKEELKILHEKNHVMLNPEHKNVYNSIIQNVYNKVAGVFFVYGSGGCGKTFMWQPLCSPLHSEGKIVLPVASCGIAAVLLPGGRTPHSRFHIPLKFDQDITAGIRHGTDIAELIQQTDLIIWDEAPMQHRHAFESVDRSLRDIMSAIDKRRENKPFGGITVVFGGDYRQILPVIQKASRVEIVGSTLDKSKIWEFCQVFLLKQNMRLHARNTEMENKGIADFSKWQLLVGDGKVENFSHDADSGEMLIKIPDQYVVHTTQSPIESLFEITYPNFLKNMSSHSYLRSRAILTPTNVVVDDINNSILEKIPGRLHTYLSQDSIDDAGDKDTDFRSAFPIEYLNSLNMPCIPKHELNIKVGVVVMLMRNLNQIMGLCNGTRMIVTSYKKNSIMCEILCGSHVGLKHLIPRIEMIPTDTSWPFEFKRIQFPLQICYAMTINKSQGQSLDTVGLYLPRAVFSHGHVYITISRVTRPEGLHILIDSEDDIQDDNHLSNLDVNNTAWTLKVRVTRMWVSTNRQGVLVRHNLILLDCENNHVLAIIPQALWNLFYFIIHPGRLLRIRNVQVLPAVGFLRPARSANHIMFLPITVVVLEPEEI